MTSRPEILDEIRFYILERAKCEENTDKYLEHVLDYCKKDYQQAYKKKTGIELTMDEVKRKYEHQRAEDQSFLAFFNQQGIKVFSFFAESYRQSAVPSNKAARVIRTLGKVRPQRIAINKIVFTNTSFYQSNYKEAKLQNQP